MGDGKGCYLATRVSCNYVVKYSRFGQIILKSKALGFGNSPRQDAKTPSSEETDNFLQTNSLPLIRPLRLDVLARDLPAFGCGFAALGAFAVASMLLMAHSARESFAATAPVLVRVGYPQPSGAQLPLWVMSEAKLDRKYGVDLQNIYISGGARLTQTLVAGDIDMATTGVRSSMRF